MSNLITDEYRDLLEWEHANTPGKWGWTAQALVNEIMHNSGGLTEWLDYGAGHGGLGIAFREKHPDSSVNIAEYEPSRPGTSAPDPADYVICVDVLEHVEPELIENVLDDLQRVTVKKGYYTISCRKAAKILKDGRNAHFIVEPPEWWRPKLEQRFSIISESYDGGDRNYRVIVEPLSKDQ